MFGNRMKSYSLKNFPTFNYQTHNYEITTLHGRKITKNDPVGSHIFHHINNAYQNLKTKRNVSFENQRILGDLSKITICNDISVITKC